MGRPKLDCDGETKFIGFKADISTKNRLKNVANNLDLNTSDIIRIAVTDFLNNFDKATA